MNINTHHYLFIICRKCYFPSTLQWWVLCWCPSLAQKSRYNTLNVVIATWRNVNWCIMNTCARCCIMNKVHRSKVLVSYAIINSCAVCSYAGLILSFSHDRPCWHTMRIYAAPCGLMRFLQRSLYALQQVPVLCVFCSFLSPRRQKRISGTFFCLPLLVNARATWLLSLLSVSLLVCSEKDWGQGGHMGEVGEGFQIKIVTVRWNPQRLEGGRNQGLMWLQCPLAEALWQTDW